MNSKLFKKKSPEEVIKVNIHFNVTTVKVGANSNYFIYCYVAQTVRI